MEVNYDTDSLVKGLVFRRSVIYKIPDSFPKGLVREGSSRQPITAFEGGHGKWKRSVRQAHEELQSTVLATSLSQIQIMGESRSFRQNGTFVTKHRTICKRRMGSPLIGRATFTSRR